MLKESSFDWRYVPFVSFAVDCVDSYAAVGKGGAAEDEEGGECVSHGEKC
jgi:hypothetical protein